MRPLCGIFALSLAAGHAAAQTPRQIWTAPVDQGRWLSASGGFVAVSGRDETVVLDAATGRNVLTSASSLGRLQSGLLLAAVGDRVEAWDLATRRQRWSHVLPRGAVHGALDGKLLYFAAGGTITCFDTESGEVVRSRSLEQSASFGGGSSAVHLTIDRVYFNIDPRWVAALVPTNLERGWKYHLHGTTVHADDSGSIMLSAWSYNILSVDSSGRLRWLRGRGERGGVVLSGATVGESVILAPGMQILSDSSIQSTYLYALDRQTGEYLWKQPMLARTPAIARNRAIVVAGHRRSPGVDDFAYYLQVHDLNSGARLWRRPLSLTKASLSSLSLRAEGDRFFLLADGRVTAYGLR
jgi:outer membrane protein assembly factor BamB